MFAVQLMQRKEHETHAQNKTNNNNNNYNYNKIMEFVYFIESFRVLCDDKE